MTDYTEIMNNAGMAVAVIFIGLLIIIGLGCVWIYVTRRR